MSSHNRVYCRERYNVSIIYCLMLVKVTWSRQVKLQRFKYRMPSHKVNVALKLPYNIFVSFSYVNVADFGEVEQRVTGSSGLVGVHRTTDFPFGCLLSLICRYCTGVVGEIQMRVGIHLSTGIF